MGRTDAVAVVRKLLQAESALWVAHGSKAKTRLVAIEFLALYTLLKVATDTGRRTCRATRYRHRRSGVRVRR